MKRVASTFRMGYRKFMDYGFRMTVRAPFFTSGEFFLRYSLMHYRTRNEMNIIYGYFRIFFCENVSKNRTNILKSYNISLIYILLFIFCLHSSLH